MRCRSQPRGDGRWLTGGRPSSTDGTVEILRRLEREFDNLKVIYAKRVWNGKLEMCNMALTQSLPGIIVQIDADEFWFADHIRKIVNRFIDEPWITDGECWAKNFWGDTDHHTEMRPLIWGQKPPWRRFFRWNGSQKWAAHEPPKIHRNREWILTRVETSAMGCYLHHYGYVHRSQVEDREKFYKCEGSLLPEWDAWQETKPLQFSSGRLIKYHGQHPIDVFFLKGSHVYA